MYAEGEDIKVACSKCKKKWRVTSSFTGSSFHCPNCGTLVDLQSKLFDAERKRLGPCDKCGEELWQLSSVSPNKTASSWQCGYCGKKEILRAHGVGSRAADGRTAIPKDVQREVWRRDKGRCVECGSQEKLEFDHIIPHSRGGSNTTRNIQLLCEKCNRKKQNRIG